MPNSLEGGRNRQDCQAEGINKRRNLGKREKNEEQEKEDRRTPRSSHLVTWSKKKDI